LQTYHTTKEKPPDGGTKIISQHQGPTRGISPGASHQEPRFGRFVILPCCLECRRKLIKDKCFFLVKALNLGDVRIWSWHFMSAGLGFPAFFSGLTSVIMPEPWSMGDRQIRTLVVSRWNKTFCRNCAVCIWVRTLSKALRAPLWSRFLPTSMVCRCDDKKDFRMEFLTHHCTDVQSWMFAKRILHGFCF